jgi:WD40 repeat protein
VDYGELIYEIPTGHGFPITGLAFSPDGRTLASIDEVEGMVVLWDINTGQQLGKPLIDHTDGGWSLAFSPDSKILASSSYDHTIILWDVDLESWCKRARARANRPLTKAEWNLFIGTDISDQLNCEDTSELPG